MHATFKLVLAVMLVSVAARSGRADIIVLPPHSTVEKMTIGDWTGKWWNWAGSFPPGMNPILDLTGSAHVNENQGGPVFFLPGVRSGTADRTFNVPGDKYLLFPLVNFVAANGADAPFKTTKEEAITVAKATIDLSTLFAQVDGVSLTDLSSHHEMTSDYFTLTVNGDFPDVGGKGKFPDAFADGYWIMLAPLGSGNHVLHYGGTHAAYNNLIRPATLDVTSRISAVPEPASLTLLGTGMVGLLAAVKFRRRPARV